MSPTRQLQDEVFFTQENYKKYSCRPSFVEYLEKHLKSGKEQGRKSQNNHDDTKADVSISRIQEDSATTEKGTRSKGAQKGGANSAPAFLGPSVEFPVLSKVSIESQKMFVEILEMLRSGQLAKVDLQEMKAVQVCKHVTCYYCVLFFLYGDLTLKKSMYL